MPADKRKALLLQHTMRLDSMQREAHEQGLLIYAHGLNRAQQALGWEAAGERWAASAALNGDRPQEARKG